MDLNAIKSRLQSLQNKKGNGGNNKEERLKNFWKPTVGKQVIRIVPSKFNKSNPFKEVYFHYGIGNKTMIALTNFGEKDPIVEFASQLKKTNDKENWKLAKKIEPKMRVFAPVIVRGEEEKGVRYWEFGKEMYLELLGIAEDEDIADYTDLMEGRDLTIDTVGPEATGTKYNKSSVRIKPKTSPLSSDNEQIKKWISEQQDVLSLYKKFEFDDMKNALQEWLEPSTETAAEEEAEIVVEAPVSSTLAPAKKKGFDEEEFDDLFND